MQNFPFLKLIALVLALSAASPAAASVPADLASPVTTPALVPFAALSGAALLLVALEDRIVDPVQHTLVSRRPLGHFCKVGDYAGRLIPNGLYLAGMLAAGAFGAEGAYQNARVMFLASAYAVSAAILLKYTVREPRPNNGADRNSFPSGHATAAFAFASVVGAQHGWGWGVPAYALATLTALSRLDDNKHYLHDVVAGAALGVGFGLGMHYLHGKTDKSVSIDPIAGPGTEGLALSVPF